MLIDSNAKIWKFEVFADNNIKNPGYCQMFVRASSSLIALDKAKKEIGAIPLYPSTTVIEARGEVPQDEFIDDGQTSDIWIREYVPFQSASELISKKISELGGWRGETLSRMRKLITEADPEAIEELKWRGVPVWSHDGIICTGESYKSVIKLTFAKGASLMDPANLFNSSLDGNVRRAIDIHEGEEVDEPAFKALILQAVALNSSDKTKRSKKTKS